MPPKKPKYFGDEGSQTQNINVDIIETEIILTEEDIKNMIAERKENKQPTGSFPSTRTIRRMDKKTGLNIKEIQHLFRIDAVGRKVRNDDVAAISWTDQPIPQDRYGICRDPYGNHTERAVFVGYDGMETNIINEETGRKNVLCAECLEFHGKRMDLAKWIGLGGLLWKPEDY